MGLLGLSVCVCVRVCRSSHTLPALIPLQILTDEDSHINSDTSSSGSAENEPPPLHLLASESEKAEKLKTSEKRLTPQPPSSQPSHSLPPRPPSSNYEHLPIVYAAHSAQPKQTVHQYKCKYPGCNQVCGQLQISRALGFCP